MVITNTVPHIQQNLSEAGVLAIDHVVQMNVAHQLIFDCALFVADLPEIALGLLNLRH
jgi:hypothetical protein